MTKSLNELSISEAGRGLRAGDFSVQELWDDVSKIARERNAELNAYLELFDADKEAIVAAQTRIDTEGDAAPLLCGIPVAMKDNILIEGKIASAASKILENHRAVYDSTVTKKLKEAGALFVGRTNMDEFGMGTSTEHSAYGPTKNPHDTSRVPGGSSGGSAAAAAAGLALGAFGSDTGGSCRQPAALCGVVGFKPTYGAVSRYGLISLGSSLDQVGQFGRTVGDVKVLYETVRGNDPQDSTTIPSDFEYKVRPTGERMRIGVPRDFLSEGIDPGMLAAFEHSLEQLKEKGHEIVDITLPTAGYALPTYYVVLPAEISSNLSRFDGMRYGLHLSGASGIEDYFLSRSAGLGAESVRRILIGTYVLSSGYIDAYYRKAIKVREVLTAEYVRAFEDVDVIATPTSPSPAFKFGEKSDDPLALYLEDVFTVTANLTGMPAISVPMGNVEREGVSLPTGIHFTAAKGAEEHLFRIGAEVTGEALY